MMNPVRPFPYLMPEKWVLTLGKPSDILSTMETQKHTLISQHTPGPWKASESKFDGRITIHGHEREVQTAVDGWTYIAQINRENIEIFEADADARLIAAAPDLLAALKGFMADFDYMNKTRPGRISSRNFAKAAREAEAAIAKAEGRT